MRNTSFSWTDGNLEAAAQMWRDGRSANEIAVALGTTKNSVLGVAHRKRAQFAVRDPLKSKTMDERERQAALDQRRKKLRVTRITNAEPIRKARQQAMMKAAGEAPSWMDGLQKHPKSDLSRFRLADVAPVPFALLNDRQCRFPLECCEVKSGPDTPCCGAETEIGIDYCGAHLVVMAGSVD